MTADRVLLAENVPWAGLGNRLRFTLSARAVADAEGREFRYSWPVDQNFGAAMTDLWRFDAEPVDRVGGAPLSEKDDLTALRDQPLWHVQSAGVVKGDGNERSWEADLQALPIRQHIADRVAEIRGTHLRTPHVGVQIRLNEKTHAKTLEASPIGWYVERMQQIVKDEPRTAFFVSCDVPSLQQDLLRAFPTAYGIEKTGAYNSALALEDSVVDLYVLAESTHLLGPYWSSFAHTAWLIGGKRQALEDAVRTRPAGSPW